MERRIPATRPGKKPTRMALGEKVEAWEIEVVFVHSGAAVGDTSLAVFDVDGVEEVGVEAGAVDAVGAVENTEDVEVVEGKDVEAVPPGARS